MNTADTLKTIVDFAIEKVTNGNEHLNIQIFEYQNVSKNKCDIDILSNDKLLFGVSGENKEACYTRICLDIVTNGIFARLIELETKK